MDKIDSDSSSNSGVTFGKCNVRSLLFADDVALLSSNKSDLQYALDRFYDACLNAGMKISRPTNKIVIICMSRHPFQCSFRTNEVTLQQTEKFKYFEFTFSRNVAKDNKLVTSIGKASSVMREFCQSIALKREP